MYLTHWAEINVARNQALNKTYRKTISRTGVMVMDGGGES